MPLMVSGKASLFVVPDLDIERHITLDPKVLVLEREVECVSGVIPVHERGATLGLSIVGVYRRKDHVRGYAP